MRISTALFRCCGGVASVLIFATNLDAQSGAGGERWLTDLPSERKLIVTRMIVRHEWLGLSWKPLFRHDHFRDHHARVWSEEMSAWTDGDWRLVRRRLSSWDASGFPLSFTTQTWTGGMWHNLDREVWSVDVDAGDRLRTRSSWHNGAWELKGRDVLRCNDDGQLGSVREYEWCDDGWRACRLTQLSYDSKGQYCGYERIELTDNFVSARSTATSDGDTGEEIHSCRERGGQWEYAERERWTRGDCGLLTDLYIDDWNEGKWLPGKWDSYINSPFTLSAGVPASRAAFRLTPRPNPTNGPMQLTVECSRGIFAAIECHDILGRKLLSLPARGFDAGMTDLTLQLGSLPRGYVFVRLVGESRVFVTQRVLLR